MANSILPASNCAANKRFIAVARLAGTTTRQTWCARVGHAVKSMIRQAKRITLKLVENEKMGSNGRDSGGAAESSCRALATSVQNLTGGVLFLEFLDTGKRIVRPSKSAEQQSRV
jgi:hypothetical protein